MLWHLIGWLVTAVIATGAVSLFVVRPFLRHRFAAIGAFYDWLDPIEAWLFASSRTVLVARLGNVVAIHDAIAMSPIASVDWTPITTLLVERVPPDYRAFALALMFAAWNTLFEWLRRITS